MKLNELREELSKTKAIQPSKTYNGSLEISKEPIIIGITGSKGKSSVAFLIHEYLKRLGKKSVLYSSIKIDSPVSFNDANEPVENPLRDEQMLLDIANECILYGAEYLVLEVNERALKNGYSKYIDFDVRVLTNVADGHNKDFYDETEYRNLKKSFLSDGLESSTIIYGIDNQEIYSSLQNTKAKNRKVFASRYVAQLRGISEDTIDYLLYSKAHPLDTLDGLHLNIRRNEAHEDFSTHLIMPYNALNILAAIATLDVLGVYDYKLFQTFIQDLTIPGRAEKTLINGITVVTNFSIMPDLEILKGYLNKSGRGKMVVVTGAVGLNFKTWKKDFSEQIYQRERANALNFTFNYINKHADIVYLTQNDNASLNLDELLDKQETLLSKDKLVFKIRNRADAITQAISNANPGDIVLISGRGNRRVLCDSYDSVLLILDQAVVDEAKKELGELHVL